MNLGVFTNLELCESRGGRPGLPSLILNKPTVSEDVKQHFSHRVFSLGIFILMFPLAEILRSLAAGSPQYTKGTAVRCAGPFP